MGVSQEDIEEEGYVNTPLCMTKNVPTFIDVVSNCWERVQLTLGLESGLVARKVFVLLRKRFNCVRKKKVGAGCFGTSRQEMLTHIS